MTRWFTIGAFGVLLSAAVTSFAQNGGIRGAVTDDNGEPLQGVAILLEFLDGVSREFRVESDDNGSFVRMGLRLGNYRLTLEKEGYAPYTEDIKVPPGVPKRLGTLVLTKLERLQAQAASDDPAAIEARETFDRGLAALDEENYPVAIEAFEKLIELTPDSRGAHYNLGVAHRETGDDAKALDFFVKAAELDPEFYEARVAMADIYSSQSRWPEAVVALKNAVEIRADSTEALYNLGGAAMNAADMETALEAFEKLLLIEPTHAPAHYQVGMIFVNKGESASAITHLEKYLELEPEGPQAATATGILDYLKQN